MYGLKDQNYNYLYDQPNEMIAFHDSILLLTDTQPTSTNLYLFEDNQGQIKLNEVRSLAPGFLQISYSKPINSFRLTGELFSAGDFARLYDTNDTINYWYSKAYMNKSEIYLVANDTLLDTARMELKFIPIDSLSFNRNNSLTIVNQSTTSKEKIVSKDVWTVEDLYKPLNINFSRPITSISESKSLHLRDSVTQYSNPKFTLDDKTKQFISIEFEKKENGIYTIEIPDSMFQDILGTWNKKIAYSFRTSSKDAYGNLRITLKTDHPENYYIIRLLNSNNDVMKEFLFTGNGERKVSAENILAGSYKFLVIEDANRNGKWDTGDFKNKVQPEKMYIYKDIYQLKGGWDLEAVVKF
jgi:hypothetical protein